MLELLPENGSEIGRHLQRLGWIGPNERIEGLHRAGEGNMNRTLRVDLGTRTLIVKQSVPFVARYPSIEAPPERIFVEAAFYRATTSPPAVALRLPTVIGFDPDNRLLALEDLGPGADFTDLYQAAEGATAIGDGQLPALLSWLGALHAMRLDGTAMATFRNAAMRALNHAHIFDIPFRRDNGLDLDAITRGLGDVARTFADDAALTTRVAALGEIYLGRAPHASTPALLHGDFYPGSWLHHPTRGVAIIDPEFAFVGPPEFDVGVLVAHLVFARVTRLEALTSYRRPEGFLLPLALAFAGVEVMRRLLGVAQLPLVADLDTKRAWLGTARQYVLASA